jgi:hypothetical protein
MHKSLIQKTFVGVDKTAFIKPEDSLPLLFGIADRAFTEAGAASENIFAGAGQTITHP